VPNNYSFILAENFTFKAWVKNDSLNAKQALFYKKSNDTVQEYTLYVQSNVMHVNFTWVGNQASIAHPVPSSQLGWMEIYVTST